MLVALVLHHRYRLGAVADVSVAAVVALVDGGAMLVGLVSRCRVLKVDLILKLGVLLLQVEVVLHIQI